MGQGDPVKKDTYRNKTNSNDVNYGEYCKRLVFCRIEVHWARSHSPARV
jgi:hypothetical protein